MTTEVVILNKLAVSLAADSAVTISGIDPSDTKVYNSTNKLFALSKHHPVGIMVYGNADLMGVPWETIIKIYRRKMDREEKDRLEEYWSDLLSFLENEFFTESQQESYFANVVKQIFGFTKNEAQKLIDKTVENESEVRENRILEILEEKIDFTYRFLDEKESISQMPSNEIKENIFDKYSPKIESWILEVFEQLPLTESQKEKLQKTACMMAYKDFFLASSGIVVAGFGGKEIFPSCFTYDVGYVIAEKLKYKQKAESSMSVKESGAGIVPLAQENIIRTFVNGMDPEIEVIYQKSLSRELEDLVKNLNEKITSLDIAPEQKDQLKELVEKKTLELVDRHGAEMRKSTMVRHTAPILDAVQFLPKDELASMAEALVNITSVKQKVSLGIETVGGPVDVAVISKGDGFIWIKRKHYFEPNLNHHFFRNYFDAYMENIDD